MVYRNAPSGKCAQFDAFIKKVCRNESRGIVRAIKRRFEKEELIAEPEPFIAVYSVQDDYPSLSDRIQVGDYFIVIKAHCLYEALMKLDEKERGAILLHVWEGMRDAEIGKIMGISQQAVHYRRTNGMESLREIIQKLKDDGNADAHYR